MTALPRLKAEPDGTLRIAHPRFVEAYRQNAGTIVAAPMIKVRLLGRRSARARRVRSPAAACWARSTNTSSSSCAPGDAFVLAGEVLRFEGLSETEAFVTRASAKDPIIPSYNSGKFPLSTHLAARVRAMLADRARVGEAADPRRRVAGAAAAPLGHPRARRGADRDVHARQRPTISSPIRSRGASPIRRSACC